MAYGFKYKEIRTLIRTGNIDVLSSLISHTEEVKKESLLHLAASIITTEGNLSMAKYLTSIGHQFNQWNMVWARSYKHPDLIEYYKTVDLKTNTIETKVCQKAEA